MSPLAIAQHGMWISARTGAGTAYHMPVVITLDHDPDLAALTEACRLVVERHPLLGSAVAERDGVPVFVPAAEQAPLTKAEGLAEVVAEPFDLERGPLVRFALVGGRTLVVVAHHLVFDGLSKDLLVAELAAAYRAVGAPGRAAGDVGAADGAPAVAGAPDAATTDADAAGVARDAAAVLAEAGVFWGGRWREPAALAVPGGTLRSRAASPGEASEFRLDLPELPGLTRFEVLTAALHALLGSYGNAEVATAIDLSTRTPAEADLIGCYVNELPLFSRPAPETSFAAFAAGLREELRASYAFRAVPLSRAVPGLRPHAALAPVSLSYRRRASQDVAAGLGEVEWLAFNGTVRGALQLQFAVAGESGEALVSLRHDPRELVDAAGFAADLSALLAAVAADPARPLGELLTFTAPTVGATVGTSDVQKHSDAAPRASVDADDPMVARILAIWEQVLDLSPIEPDDDLFDLGGHSLTITQIIARMQQQLGVEISLDDFFDNPTVAGVVAVIRS
ncbi:condensation domain-containing protein [Streptacidiphilus jiangxiensis]|uniref:Condensation domain-containing protein n=1 Tax=Streptacidiphilus jiangxiensis TaxID=235985 RepID=A0A1H7FZL4_STRJI|nr:condensation domain-containing protein [Streptacidiphilus jiangxiensis]SEK31348.1 Condensation domain-containing protein [Streptacidiphilus jiangxiensis]